MKITIVTVSTTVLGELIKVNENIRGQYPDVLELKLFYAARSMNDETIQRMKKSIEGSDAVIVDLMGSPRKIIKGVLESLKKCKGNIIPVGGSGRELLRLGALTADDMGGKSAKSTTKNKMMGKSKSSMSPEAMQKMADMAEKLGKVVPFGKPKDMRNLIQIDKYFKNADYTQLLNMFYLLLRDYGNFKQLPKPQEALELPDIGICDAAARTYYKSSREYFEKHGYDKNKPVAAILFYGHTYPNNTSPCVSQITQKISEFANILPIAFSTVTVRNHDKLREWLLTGAGKKADLIVNFMSFRIGAGPMGGKAQDAVNILKETDALVLHPFFMSRRETKEWMESAQGINSTEFMISVMLPELDGCIETYPIGAMKSMGRNSEFNFEINELEIIDERVEKLVSRIKSWLLLRTKNNSEKKAAVICYNYPPGEDNLFGGAFLDTFKSVEEILKNLKDNGFNVEALSAKQLMESFTAGKNVNSGRWQAEDSCEHMIKYDSSNYCKDLNKSTYQSEMIKQWETPPGNIMTSGKDFLIPGIKNGNIFIGLQPSRGVHENPDKVYHDKTLLPHHQYIAFYKWIKEEFKADVVIHVGTHGTLEFLKGKECGMSGECFPDMLLYDIPHIYLYYCGNPAEAMIAKRRSHAVLTGYQPPSFMEGNIYGEYEKLSAMIDEYHESLRISPARSSEVLKNVMNEAERNNLPINLEELERELYRMKRSLIPKGLHVFGKAYTKNECIDYISFVLRYDRGDCKSLRRVICEKQSMNYDEILEKNKTEILSELDKTAEKIIKSYFKDKTSILKDEELKKYYSDDLVKCLEYGEGLYHKCSRCFENEGLLRCLEGRYQPSKLSGDIIRNPEVMPSGFNLYQFDPRFVPSITAYQRGSKVAENTINQYKKEHGEYPVSTAVILWGLETSRTQGETVGQILSYLGVKVTHGSNIWEPQYEIIPVEELKRPRIDVVVNICGFFRDMFPNIIDDFNRVLERLEQLNEPDELNHYRANVKKIYKSLRQQGYDEDEARELSRSRIFGPAEGEYGTGITKMIETKNWEDETQIGETYVKSLKHVYSKNFRGRDVEGLFNDNLKTVDIVSQIRSNHEYEVTDLDHYYEYFGGLAKSVEMAKGKKSEIYISDTTGERIETEGAEKSINRGIRTRMLNPKWIDGMLEHKYHGVQKIAQRFENIMGLAATTNRVEQWIYNDLHSKYIEDEEMRKRLKDNNRWAYISIIEQMMEYNQRGYWNADQEQLEKLKEVYLEIEGDIEENTE